MRKLGQHFLSNSSVIRKIVDAIDVREGDNVLEIGPGRGALTFPLAAACSAAGAKFTAIEKDAALAATLVEAAPEVDVIPGDALKELPRMMGGGAAMFPTKLVGNLPYYITGHLLKIIGELERKPGRCVFMVQREVAERIVAIPPRMNRLAASVRFWADASMIATVPRRDFSPPPDVDSAVIVLNAKRAAEEPTNEGGGAIGAERYYRAVRAIFAQPRKTLLNNLAAALRNCSKEELSQKLAMIGLKPDARPQDIGPEELARIAAVFF